MSRKIGTVTVLNHHHEGGVRGISIMRPGRLGNPFSHLSVSAAEYRVPTREEAIAAFERWYDTPAAEDYRESVRLIAERVAQGVDVPLVCCCKPKPCHGDFLREKIIELATEIFYENEGDKILRVGLDKMAYRCQCGCNVFRRIGELRYRCNGCRETYTGED